MAIPWGGIAQGVGALASSLIGNQGSKRAQDRANAQNIAFWRMQNEYNHPSSQMARLRDAGLNPNLIYGQSASGSSGNAERVAPAKAPEFNMESPLRGITNFSDIKQREATSDNLRIQNTVLRQEAILKAAQTGRTLAEGSSARTKASVDKALLQTSVDASKENLRQLELGTIDKRLDNRFKSESLKNRVKDIHYRVQNAKATLEGTKLSNELKALERDLKRIGIERNDPWYFRIFGRAIGKDGFDEIIQGKRK